MRHPPVEAGGRCYGRLDLPARDGWSALLPGLIETARLVAPRRVLSSPLSRCLRPAARLAEALGIDLRCDDRLLELDFGAWEGQLWDRVPRAALDRWAADPLGFAPPGGESGDALLARITAVRDALLADPVPCIVVTHGGPLRLLAPLLLGRTVDLLAPAPAPGTLELVEIPLS